MLAEVVETGDTRRGVVPAADPTRRVRPGPPSSSPTYVRGQSIGRYVVLETLGRGGMGQVFGAFDPELDRRVAIKVLLDADADFDFESAGRDPGSCLLREAQALAKLSHPNVVPVFDVGAVDGQVFIAMEYVDGWTLAKWVAAEARGWRSIVRKFVAAGRGLAAAHAIGLIHRDFKPSNVLLGKDESVRVMDFGLARLGDELEAPNADTEFAPEVDAPTSRNSKGHSVTAIGTVAGTPLYMAPEQHRGDPLESSADQYAFCVALYEALYGCRPFAKASSAELLEAKERLCLQPLPAGAEMGVPRWLRKVVLRGLEPDPALRWPSMQALLGALDRDPRRAVSRIAAAAAGVGLAVLTGWAYGQSQERDAEVCSGGPAALEGVWDPATQAKMERAFLASDIKDARATWNRVEATLERYTRSWIDMHRVACQATHLHHEQSEAILDLRMACLDGHLRNVRAITDVFGNADVQVVRNAIKIAGTLRPVDDCSRLEQLQSKIIPPTEAQAVDVDAIRDRIAQMSVLDTAGKYDEALVMAKEAFEQAKIVGYRPVLAETQHFLGGIQGRLGQYETAVENLREAGWLAEGQRHDEVAAKAQITVASILGYRLGQPQAGLAWGRHAKAVVARLDGEDEYEAMLHVALASVHGTAGDWDKARDHDQRALEARIKALGPDHIEVAAQHNNVAIDASALGQPEDAIRHYERAIEVYRKAFGPRHPHIAITLGNLANTLRQLGRYREAIQRFDQSVPMLEATVGSDHPYVGVFLGNRAKTEAALGQVKLAHETFARAIRIQEASMGTKGPYLVDAVLSFAESLADDGQLDRAEEVTNKAGKLIQEGWKDHAGYNAGLLYLEGRLLVAKGDGPAAIERFRRGLGWLEGERTAEVTEDGGPGWRLSLLLHLGRSLLANGANRQATEVLQRAMSVASRQHSSTDHADTSFALARAVLASTGDRDRARELANQALSHYAEAGEPLAERRELVSRWVRAHL